MLREKLEGRILTAVTVVLAGALVAAAALSSRRQDTRQHPMFGRTPDRNMANPGETGLPAEWNLSDGTNVLWAADLGSQSYGNPVVSGGRVFLGTNNAGLRNPQITGDKGVIMCFDAATGRFLWQLVHDKLAAGRVNDWPLQGICSSPYVEGDRLYYVSNRAELVCADVNGLADGNDGPFMQEQYTSETDGDIIWRLDMIGDLSVFPHNLAVCCPLIVGDLVFIVTGNGVDEGHVDIPFPNAPSFLAVNKNTGEIVWQSNLPGENIFHGQWSNPTYAEIDGVRQVIFPGGDGYLYSFVPETGELIWQFNCNPPGAVYELGGAGTANEIIATPVVYEDRIYIGVGQDPEHGDGVGHLWCIDPRGAEGDISESGVVWHFGDFQDRRGRTRSFGRTISTVAVADGLVYAASLSGFLHCLDADTGERYWTYDCFSAVWGSPFAVDGKVYLGDEEGDVAVLAQGREFQLLAENRMDNTVFSTPVAVDGVLYVMTKSRLYALQQQEQ